jgi:glycerophosphoryl diester phosphodiesterase
MLWPRLDIERSALEFLTRQPFAHRGLHDADNGVPENSLSAFDHAIMRGYGIELDVRMTRDGDVIVFHDATLDRMADASGPVIRRSAAELQKIRLKGSPETLQTLHDVLLHIRGRVPVLIEVKANGGQFLPACFAVRRALEGYRGPVAVMSFHPGVPAWYARNAPNIVRGLVMTEEERRPLSPYDLRAYVRRQFCVWQGKPHFIAHDVRRLPLRFASAVREQGRKLLTWTVRGDALHAVAARWADQVIFEGELPAAPSVA